MTCPACGRTLHEVESGGVKVDVCTDGCAGLWFDAAELKHFDEPHEGAGEALLDFVPRSDSKIDPTQRRRCPNCPDSVMMQHFTSVRRSVVLDECPTCAAIWLDPGELRTIRIEFPTEAARREAAREYFRDVFGERLDAAKQERAARIERSKNIFSFLWHYLSN
jgi:Zn-finger nucleic acid-binding protein